MEFLNVGPAELVVILVVALVFVGPQRLPKLAADIARTIREIRKYTSSLAAEFNDVVKDFEKDTEGERSTWKEIGEGLAGATKSVTDAVRGAHADAQGMRDPVAVPAAVSEAIAQVPTDDPATSAPPKPVAADLGSSGKGVRDFRRETPSDAAHAEPPGVMPALERFCMECGSPCAASLKFCAECGTAILAIA